MKLSPLQLIEYFVSEFHYGINSRYDGTKDLELRPDELAVETNCSPGKANPRVWTVTLQLKYQPAAERNTPYVFSISVVGFFEVAKIIEDGRMPVLVRTNGASVLYGTAREIIREQTSRGPAGPFLLPTASFLVEDPPSTPAPAVPAAAEREPAPSGPGPTQAPAGP